MLNTLHIYISFAIAEVLRYTKTLTDKVIVRIIALGIFIKTNISEKSDIKSILVSSLMFYIP